MESFKVFLEEMNRVDRLVNEFNGAPSTQVGPVGENIVYSTATPEPLKIKIKPWSAKKSEIMQMWRNLRTDIPILVSPISDTKMSGENSTYGEDGIRITGSWHFISSVLSRLKELLAYENPQTKLRLIFRGIDKARDARPDRHSYVFYFNLERRTHGKPGRPKRNMTNLTPQMPIPGQGR
jgi:hypothetical protein